MGIRRPSAPAVNTGSPFANTIIDRGLADSTVLFQNACDAGGIWTVGPGTFFVSDEAASGLRCVDITKSVRFVGSGAGITIIKPTSANQDWFLFYAPTSATPFSYISFEGITFDGRYDPSTLSAQAGQSGGVGIAGASKFSVRLCEFLNFAHVGATTGMDANDVQVTSVDISHNRFEKCWLGVSSKGGGVTRARYAFNEMQSIRSGGFTMDGESVAPPTTPGHDMVVIQGNIIDGLGWASAPEGGYGIGVQENVHNLLVTGNVIRAGVGTGFVGIDIEVGQTDQPVERVRVSDNVVEDMPSKGIRVVTAANSHIDDLAIVNNTVKDSILGIEVTGSTTLLVRRLSIGANKVTDMNKGSAGANTGIQVTVDDLVDSFQSYDNWVNDIDGWGMYLSGRNISSSGDRATSCTRYGIEVKGPGAVAGERGVSVVGARCSGNDRAGLRINACPKASVHGGHFFNNGGSATDPYGVMLVASPNATVTGIAAKDTQTVKTQTYGIYIDADSDDSLIQANDVQGNATGGINDASTTMNSGTIDANLNRTA